MQRVQVVGSDEKKAYQRPNLTELGQLRELTLGVGGNLPDYQFGTWQQVNNDCQGTWSGQKGCVQ